MTKARVKTLIRQIATEASRCCNSWDHVVMLLREDLGTDDAEREIHYGICTRTSCEKYTEECTRHAVVELCQSCGQLSVMSLVELARRAGIENWLKERNLELPEPP